MGRINLSRVVSNPMMAENYTIRRSVGSFVLGGWQKSWSVVAGYGVISNASDEDLEMIPEGDRVTGAIVVHSVDRIYITSSEVEGGGYSEQPFSTSGYGGGEVMEYISDQVVWNNQTYRILHVGPYPNRGYWKGIAVKMRGH
jgi:hypothetical protein